MARKKRRRVGFNNMKDNWTNDTKDQMHLTPGSPEYAEYVEDLKEHDPFRPDDPMHEKLESYNADLVEKLAEKAYPQADPVDQRKARLQAQKRAKQAAVHAKAVRAALQTPDKQDDVRAKELVSEDPLVYDDSVLSDEYEQKAEEYVLDP